MVPLDIHGIVLYVASLWLLIRSNKQEGCREGSTKNHRS